MAILAHVLVGMMLTYSCVKKNYHSDGIGAMYLQRQCEKPSAYLGLRGISSDAEHAVRVRLAHVASLKPLQVKCQNMLSACRLFASFVNQKFFLCWSTLTPPGPSATTRRRPPITDMVWKKSYLHRHVSEDDTK